MDKVQKLSNPDCNKPSSELIWIVAIAGHSFRSSVQIQQLWLATFCHTVLAYDIIILKQTRAKNDSYTASPEVSLTELGPTWFSRSVYYSRPRRVIVCKLGRERGLNAALWYIKVNIRMQSTSWNFIQGLKPICCIGSQTSWRAPKWCMKK